MLIRFYKNLRTTCIAQSEQFINFQICILTESLEKCFNFRYFTPLY